MQFTKYIHNLKAGLFNYLWLSLSYQWRYFFESYGLILFKETSLCIDETKHQEFTHGLVLLLGCKPLLLDPRHVEDVGLGQSFLDAVELLLPERKNTRPHLVKLEE